MTRKLTQRQRILNAFCDAPEHRLSLRYIKRDMGITEANGRISELRAMGYDIQPVGEDDWGFTIQELRNAPPRTPKIVFEMRDGVRTAVMVPGDVQ